MTNAPANRKTHVVRILGTNRAGEVLRDMWADVERMDIAKSVYQDGDTSTYQGLERHFKWLDDPSENDFNAEGNPSRRTRIVRVCSPDEDNVNDPDRWIPIPVVGRVNFHSQQDSMWQGKVERFINDELTSSRVVEARRIYHYDTSIDDEAAAAFDADPERRMFVVPGERYRRDDATKDDGQYVEHEIIKFLKKRVNRETRTGAGSDQGKQTKLLNQYLIDESEEARLEIKGLNDVNPPYRLDPYQNIVNVNFGGATWFSKTSRAKILIGSDAQEVSILTIIVDGNGGISCRRRWAVKQTVNGTDHFPTGTGGGFYVHTSDLVVDPNEFSMSGSVYNFTYHSDVQVGAGQRRGCRAWISCLLSAGPGEGNPPVNGDTAYPSSAFPNPSFECIPTSEYGFWDAHGSPPPFVDPSVAYSTGWYRLVAGYGSETAIPGDFWSVPGNYYMTQTGGSGDRVSPSEKNTAAAVSWQSYAQSWDGKTETGQSKIRLLLNDKDYSNKTGELIDIQTGIGGDTDNFYDNWNCATSPIASGFVMPDFPGIRGGADITSDPDNPDTVFGLVLGNGFISNRQEILDKTPNEDGMAVYLVMIWSKFVDWSDYKTTLFDRDSKGNLTIKKSKAIVDMVGQPSHWYEGGPAQFPRNRVGGDDLQLSGEKLKSYTPTPASAGINVHIDNPHHG